MPAEYAKTGFKDFDGNPVWKVTLNIPREVGDARKLLQNHNIPCYEADIRFAYRFLIDFDIKGCMEMQGEFEKGTYVDRVYREPTLSPSLFQPMLKVLSLDIETDRNAEQIYSIALYGKGYQKVLITKQGSFQHTTCFTTEKEMLEAFQKEILSHNPDVIVGWNLIDFDFMVLKQRCDFYKLPFKLGRTDDLCSLRLTESFFMDSKADFPGRIVLDGIRLAKMSFLRLEDYKLNTAAKAILGEEKMISNEEKREEVTRLYQEDPAKLIAYNLHDAELVYKIIEKTKLLELSIKRSMLTRMQLDRVNASIASLDSLYLKELQKKKIVAPSANVNEEGKRITGGHVMSSKPGIYENILVFDFKSLYPSIIRTFNIDPCCFVESNRAKQFSQERLIQAPNGAFFLNEEGILPMLIQDLWEQRDRAKKEKDTLASNAIKILMNSFFGVLANPTCRFYNLEMANAITHFGQFLIKLTAEKIQELGYTVIYGDTDSIFVHLGEIHKEKAKEKAQEIEAYINAFFQAYTQKNYQRKSFLQLEFEKVYKKFLMPRIRGTDIGAKKRYAGILEEQGKEILDFVGLEQVRRDWTDLAKKFQAELLRKVFNGESPTIFVKDFVEEVKQGKHDDLLIYKKAIRKSVEEYTKTTPPHIQAARKMGRTKTGLIEYIMTLNGPEPLEQLQSSIDYQHYIEKQIQPIADSILSFTNMNFQEMVQGHKQVSLLDF